VQIQHKSLRDRKSSCLKNLLNEVSILKAETQTVTVLSFQHIFETYFVTSCVFDPILDLDDWLAHC